MIANIDTAKYFYGAALANRQFISKGVESSSSPFDISLHTGQFRYTVTDYVAVFELRLKTHAMGTIHKFKRPPKNESQFKGFQPLGPATPKRAPGRRQKLQPWQRGLLAWTLLIMIAAGIVGVRMLFAAAV